MIQKLRKLKESKLVTVSLFSAMSTVIKMLTAFVTAKIIATFLGPSGLGVIGQLNSFVLIVLGFATGAINNGVIKYVAEYADNIQKQRQVIHASIQISIVSSLLVCLVIVGFSEYWSEYIFGERNGYRDIILVFGFTLIFYSLYSVFVSILNGLQLFRQFNAINIITSIIGLFFTLTLIFYDGLQGALLATVTYQSIMFVGLFFYFRKASWLSLTELWSAADKAIYIRLFKFSLMSLITILCVPYAQILIRKLILNHSGADVVGFYEGVSRISTLYLTMITSTLSVYYLPRLSEIKEVPLLKKEILQGYKILIPALIAFASVFYLCRNLVIEIAFTSEFQPMSAYFLPQLIGDILKISSWLLAFLMLAKAMTVLFIVTEIIFSATLVLLSIYLVNLYGGIGAIYAYMINYALYLITMVCVFRKIIFHK